MCSVCNQVVCDTQSSCVCVSRGFVNVPMGHVLRHKLGRGEEEGGLSGAQLREAYRKPKEHFIVVCGIKTLCLHVRSCL